MDGNPRSQVDLPLTKADLWPIVGVLLLVLVLYHPLFFGRPVMPDTWKRYEPWNSELGYDGPLDPRIQNANNDGILQYTCWNAFAHRELRAGRIPAWDPYCLCGVPLAANHLAPVFYPMYAAIAWLASPLYIMGISGLLHTLIMGLFFYLFIREWLNHRLAAWMAASFLVVSLLPNPHYQPWPMTLAWFPAYWFFFERWLKHRSVWSGLWMSLCCAAVLLSGYPSLIIQLSLFTAVWVLVRPQMMDPADRPSWLARVWILIWPFLIALSLSAIQNIPTLTAATESDRTLFKSSEELAREASFTIPADQPWQIHVKRLLQPMLPFRFPGNDFFNRGHVGVVAVMFALFGLAWLRDKRYPRIAALLALIVAPFALIPAVNFGMYWLTGEIAIDPNPPVEVFGFLVLMLAAVGVREWSEPAYETDERRLGHATILTMVAAAIAMTIAGLRPTSLLGVASEVLAFSAIFVVLVPLGFKTSDKAAAKYKVAMVCVWLFIAAVDAGFSWLAPPAWGPYHEARMAKVPAIDELVDLSTGSDVGRWGRIIRYSSNPVDVMSLADQPYTFYPNLGTYFEIPDAFGYHNLAPASRLEYLRGIQEDAVIERRGIVAFTIPYQELFPRVGDIGVRYVLSDSEIVDIHPVYGKLIYGGGGFYVYEINDRLVDGGLEVPQTHFVQKLDNGDWYYSTIPCGVGFVPPEPVEYAEPTLAVDEPGHILVESDQTVESVLVVNEGYSNGWRATIDGEKATVHPFDTIKMAVDVPAGRHVIEFRYGMPGLSQGMMLTGIGCVLWIVLAVVATRRGHRRREAGS